MEIQSFRLLTYLFDTMCWRKLWDNTCNYCYTICRDTIANTYKEHKHAEYISSTYLGSHPRTSAIPTNERRKGIPTFDAWIASSRWPMWRASNFPKATIPPIKTKIYVTMQKRNKSCFSRHKSVSLCMKRDKWMMNCMTHSPNVVPSRITDS